MRWGFKQWKYGALLSLLGGRMLSSVTITSPLMSSMSCCRTLFWSSPRPKHKNRDVLHLFYYAAPLVGILFKFFQLSAIHGFTLGGPGCPHQDMVILLFDWLTYALGPSATLWFSEGAVAVFLLSMGATGLRFARGSSSRPDDLVVRVLGSVGSALSGPLYLPCISSWPKTCYVPGRRHLQPPMG